MQPIRRHFLITALVSSLLALGLLGFGMVHIASQQMIEQETRANTNLTQVLSRLVWPRFSGFIASTHGQSPMVVAKAPEIAELDALVSDFIGGSSILKIKLYNLEGFTIYSSEHAQIGQYRSDNPGFQAAAQGQIRSALAYRNTFHSFERTFTERNLISTYIPLYDPGTQEIRAVFELYSDVSPLVEGIERKRWLSIVLGLCCLAFPFIGLYLTLRHAERLPPEPSRGESLRRTQ